jgi:dTDP-4-dehydrorhamnose reductase
VGASGLVGGALLRSLGASSVGTYRSRPRPGLRPLDAADPKMVAELIDAVSPELIFFPAANPNVDWCEREPEQARRENLDPLRTVLAVARGVPLVAYSSDYVFDGSAGPYAEPDDVSPISVYGRIKVELERLVLAAAGTVIRTTGVFGWEPAPARNFVLRLASSLERGERARIPNDQIANPTYADDLAAASIEIARAAGRGVWHVAGAELVARDQFARVVAETWGLGRDLIDGVPTSALGQLAPRPLRGGLSCARYLERFGAAPGRPMREALADLRTRASTT